MALVSRPTRNSQPKASVGRSSHCICESSSPEKRIEILPRQTIQDRFLIQPGAARLIDAVADGPELAGAVSIGRHGNEDSRFMCEAGILGRKVEAIGAGIDLEKTAALFRVLDNTLDVEFITRPLE